MGSFNKKGFISNIPIEYGERCSLIFMKFNKFEMSGNTYPTFESLSQQIKKDDRSDKIQSILR